MGIINIDLKKIFFFFNRTRKSKTTTKRKLAQRANIERNPREV